MSGRAVDRLAQHRRNHFILNSMTPQTLLEIRQFRVLESRKIFPEPCPM